MSEHLTSWNEGPVKGAVVRFVEQVVATDVPMDERVATFDADGTLWCERPVPTEAAFILEHLAEMAKDDPDLRGRQPWKAAYDHDDAWLGKVITDHYAGDDTGAMTLLGGIGTAFASMDVEDFQAQAGAFLRGEPQSGGGRDYRTTAYAPMLELLRYLEANGFSTHIVSGSGNDFMRPISQEVFGIPPERLIGSETPLRWTADHGGRVTRDSRFGFLDDGPQKPIQIWNRIGRRPLVAGGNSNGDVPMLEFAPHPDRPSLRLLLVHDDPERESAYTSGAEQALAAAGEHGWTVVSMKNDFKRVY